MKSISFKFMLFVSLLIVVYRQDLVEAKCQRNDECHLLPCVKGLAYCNNGTCECTPPKSYTVEKSRSIRCNTTYECSRKKKCRYQTVIPICEDHICVCRHDI
ncbi:unnamed protein product [Arabidopsis halleri]